MHQEQTETEYGEGAPVISAASARRRGPSFALKLSSCCEVDRWRDSEWAPAAPAAPAEMAERQSCGQYISLQHLYAGHIRFEIHCSCKFNLQLFVNSTLEAIHVLRNSEF